MQQMSLFNFIALWQIWNHVNDYSNYLKPFLKGKNFAVEWERGKFDFDHYFVILTNFLKR